MKHGLIDRRDFEDWLIENCTRNMAQLVKGYIKEQPIVDAVPVVHGEWINPSRNQDIVNKDFFSDCSVCGETFMDESNYCPSCGAKMKKPKLQHGDEDSLQGGLMSAM